MKQLLTKLPFGLAGEIYRSPLPFSPIYDPYGELIDAYQAAGIDVVVMLTPIEEVIRMTGVDLLACYQTLGLRVIHAPIEDFSTPEKGALLLPIEQTLAAAQAGENIVIHCHAGVGRTGLFIACLARVVFELSAADAVDWVRRTIPSAVENEAQMAFIRDFELPRGWGQRET
jgi:hypothetical protein